MASFRVNLSDTDVYAGVKLFDGETGRLDKLKICQAGAAVLIDRLRDWLDANTHDLNEAVRGALAKSLKAKEVYDTVFVQPSGKHHGRKARRTRAEGYHRAKTGQGRGRSNPSAHHGMSSGASASDVGYYLEYGTARMDARHWMETVVEESADEVTAAMAAAFDEYLKSKGL